MGGSGWQKLTTCSNRETKQYNDHGKNRACHKILYRIAAIRSVDISQNTDLQSKKGNVTSRHKTTSSVDSSFLTNWTIRLFDWNARFDLAYAYKEFKIVSARWMAGQFVLCKFEVVHAVMKPSLLA